MTLYIAGKDPTTDGWSVQQHPQVQEPDGVQRGERQAPPRHPRQGLHGDRSSNLLGLFQEKVNNELPVSPSPLLFSLF